MKKVFIMVMLAIFVSSIVQYGVSISLNPKRAACEQSCTEAKKKCIADANNDEVKKQHATLPLTSVCKNVLKSIRKKLIFFNCNLYWD